PLHPTAQGHQPIVAFTPDEGIPKTGYVHTLRRSSDHRVSRPLGPGFQLPMGAGCDGLHLRLCSGVDDRRDIPIHHHAARKYAILIVATWRWRQGDREVRPAKQIAAYGMPPMHVTPFGCSRIVL